MKLFQHLDAFRCKFLSEEEKFIVNLKSVMLHVCHITVNPHMKLSVKETMKTNPALYPFWESNLKAFTISKGAEEWSIDNTFAGFVPSKVVIVIVKSASFNGKILMMYLDLIILTLPSLRNK